MGNIDSKLVLPVIKPPTLVPGEWCYYYGSTSGTLEIVVRGHPSKYITDITTGSSNGDEALVDTLNKHMGLDDSDTFSILCSSIAVSVIGVRS